jgi:phosphocarrier protein
MMLMGMGVKCGDTVNITVEGEDEEAAAEAVEKFLNENL